MARRFLLLCLLFIGFAFITAAFASSSSSSSSSRRLRGDGGQESKEGWADWWSLFGIDDTDDDDNDNDDQVDAAVMASLSTAAEDLEGNEQPPSFAPAAAATTTAAPAATTTETTVSTQGTARPPRGPPYPIPAPATIDRWVVYDDEYLDPTYFFPGDVKPTWESVHGEIRLNGHPFHVKGISWFGFETDTRCVGLLLLKHIIF